MDLLALISTYRPKQIVHFISLGDCKVPVRVKFICTWATKKIKTNETKSASYVWTNHVYIFKIYILISSSDNDNSEGVLTHN